jgi:surface polysaccharide O-acyltransferase-like enzyme
MYFGLYLLMPFLNKLWQSLSEKQKHMLLAAMIIICVLPFAVNVKFKIMPNYFYPLWPFLYYFAGAWLREFRIPLNNKIKTAIALILPCVMGLVEIFVMKIAKPSAGGEGVLRYGGYQSLGVFISAMLLFEMLLRVRAEKLPRAVTKTISFITKYSIGIYLFSFFSDAVVYKIVNRLPDFSRKIVWWPVAFICSYAIAAVLSVIVTGCYDFAEKFVRRRLVAGKVQKS